ncbi:hypothetical protein F4801DRAFT_581804 [Xylaria longipes]|nr:hypothetical protein F4801DRAFT_581804 [Xylaria longipes]
MQLRKKPHRLFTLFNWQPRKEQSPKNYFLQQPVELVMLVTDYLTPVDLCLLSQTCWVLRSILGKRGTTTGLLYAEHLSYLTYRARGLPEEWACEECMTLHPIIKTDTPASIHGMTCPFKRNTVGIHTLRQILDNECLLQNKFRIAQRHVQLALKYARLQRHEYDSCLQALTAPHHNANFGPAERIPLKTHFSAYPKIIAGPNGDLRFLLLSTWRYYKGTEDICVPGLGQQIICPHLYTYRAIDPKLRRPLLHFGIFESVVNQALKARGQVRAGSCTLCATDFAVRLSSEYLDLHVWQDLGPECYPIDLAWHQGHLAYPCLEVYNSTWNSNSIWDTNLT